MVAVNQVRFTAMIKYTTKKISNVIANTVVGSFEANGIGFDRKNGMGFDDNNDLGSAEEVEVSFNGNNSMGSNIEVGVDNNLKDVIVYLDILLVTVISLTFFELI